MISPLSIGGADTWADFSGVIRFRSPLPFAKRGRWELLAANVVPDEFCPKMGANALPAVGN
jgi:hypothetical protein